MSVDNQVPVTMTLRSNTSLKAGKYTLPVRINYLNNLRENLSTTILVPITIASGVAFNTTRTGGPGRTTGGGIVSTVIDVIIVLAILAVAFWYARKKGMLKRFTHKTK
jgi:acyl-coenzyme A thioesterase PaaI-like protein